METAEALNVHRAASNVVASEDSTMAGEGFLVFRARGGNAPHVLPLSPYVSTSIPALHRLTNIFIDAQWILILEKSTAKKRLMEGGLSSSLEATLGKGLLVTGRGFADLAARDFVRQVAINRPDMSIFLLTDGDVGGIWIARQWQEAFGRDRGEWLGITADHIKSLPAACLTELTAKEAKSCRGIMLAKEMSFELKYQTEALLGLGQTARLDVLSRYGGSILTWTQERLVEAMKISSSCPSSSSLRNDTTTDRTTQSAHKNSGSLFFGTRQQRRADIVNRQTTLGYLDSHFGTKSPLT